MALFGGIPRGKMPCGAEILVENPPAGVKKGSTRRVSQVVQEGQTQDHP